MNKGYYINEAKCSKEVFDNYMDLLHESKQLKEVIEELNELLSDEFIEVLDKETIIQILDKVKEVKQ